jgi:hypothetical protein
MSCKFFVRNIVPAALLLCVFHSAATLQLLTSGDGSGLARPIGGSQRRDGDASWENTDGWNSGVTRSRGSRRNRRTNTSSCSDSKRGGNNGDNVDWKDKYDTLLNSYSNLQIEFTKIKQTNAQLEKKLRDLERNGTPADLRIRIQRLEGVIEDLKARLSASEREAAQWRKKYEDVACKLDEYQNQITKLNMIIADLRREAANSATLKKQLDDAYRKIADLQKALDQANDKLKKLTSRRGNSGRHGGSSRRDNNGGSSRPSYTGDDSTSIGLGVKYEDENKTILIGDSRE